MISCLVSGFILFSIPNTERKQLDSLAQADSLIEQQFSDFNISKAQVRVATIRIDSGFHRKTYHVGVPYQFSKTQFHTELNQLLYSYDIETPARVTFPEQDINIQLAYQNTIIRTISLQTDPKLSLQQNNISILLAFEELPGSQILSDLASLGEHLPLVLKIEQPMQVQHIKEQLNRRYTPVIFWMQNKYGKDLIKENPDAAAARLDRLQEISPNAKILVLHEKEILSTLGNFSKLTFIDAADNLLLHEELGQSSFFKELDNLETNTKQFSALITANNTTISWLRKKLPDLKKSGVNIVPPPKMNL